MRIVTKAAITALLSLGVSNCTTAGNLFSYDTERTETARTATVEPASSNEGCNRIATERADDAVLAYYVTEGSAAAQDIYKATYRDCVAWADR